MEFVKLSSLGMNITNASSGGFRETVRIRILVWAFAGNLFHYATSITILHAGSMVYVCYMMA